MADTTALKNRIRAAIKANDNQEITGPVLQQALLDIVDEFNGATETEASQRQNGDSALQQSITAEKNRAEGVEQSLSQAINTEINTEKTRAEGVEQSLSQAINSESQTRQSADTQLNNLITGIKNNIDNGYVYAGIATPTTVPVSGKVFYIAVQAGTYTNFGEQVLTQGINILRYNGSTWSNQQVIGIDDAAVAGSKNLITSDAVAMSQKAVTNAIQDVYKKSNYNDGDNIIDFNTIHLITDNPEFVCVAVDVNEKILYGIKTDGQPYFGVGCPQQVKDYIDKQINKILGTDDISSTIDSLKEIEVFLKDFTNSDTLKKLLDLKANVDDVRITTNDIYKKSNPNDSEGNVVDTNTIVSIENNPEYIKVITDNVGKLIEAIGLDGIRKFFAGIDIQGISQCVIDNPDYTIAWVDKENRIIFAIQPDGNPYFGYGVPKQIKTAIDKINADIVNKYTEVKQSISDTTADIDKKINFGNDVYPSAVLSLQENPEYLAVEKDADGKILSSTNADGSHYIHNAKSETIPTEFEHIEDPEGRTEITSDADGKVMSYRDSSGKKHEHDMEVTNLDVSNINLQGNSVNNIQDALKANGFDIKGKTDWSDWYDKHDSALELPIPTKAVINITGVNQMPSKKLVNDKAYIEFFDFAGNYFKIKAYLNAQGASTMADPMKSCAIDLFSDDWGGNEFEIKFGDWVAQDGFHLKAFYKDSLKSIQPICYEIGEQIISFLNVRSNRFHISSDNVLIGGTGDMDNDVSQAKCMPSQFPCEVYLNGEYYGLFIWSLKKNRKNYSMNKKDYTSILIDNVGGMFNGDSFNWISAEIRNPKKLICVDGKEYDADTHMGELIGTDTVAGQQYTFSKLNAATTGTDTFKVTSVDYNVSNKDMVNTAKTKAIIEACQSYKSEVNSASTNEEKKKIVEKSFDVDNVLAYIIFCELTYNQDGWYNNAQITIYDKKVGYNIYDCDSCLGKAWNGILWTSSLSREVLDTGGSNPLLAIKGLYVDEIGAMYKTLRDKGIITKENLNKIVDDWFDRLGTDALKRSVTKWNNSPSYRKPTNLDEHWEPYIPLSKSELESINSYNAETNYSVGTIVCYGNGGYNNYYYKCVKECLGSAPTTDGNYFTNGMYDSKERIKMWLEKRIDFCDILWNYK